MLHGATLDLTKIKVILDPWCLDSRRALVVGKSVRPCIPSRLAYTMLVRGLWRILQDYLFGGGHRRPL